MLWRVWDDAGSVRVVADTESEALNLAAVHLVGATGLRAEPMPS